MTVYKVDVFRDSDSQIVAVCSKLNNRWTSHLAYQVEAAALNLYRANPVTLPRTVEVEVEIKAKWIDLPDLTTAVMLLSAAGSSGDVGAITLAAQLAGCAPCPSCGYVNYHCKCGDQNGTSSASGSGHPDQTGS
jgi:hypothetical protein